MYESIDDNYQFNENELFQSTIEEILTTTSNSPEFFTLQEKLISLGTDFVTSALNYGKIIINEIFIPVEKKTIKPIQSKNSFFLFFQKMYFQNSQLVELLVEKNI